MGAYGGFDTMQVAISDFDKDIFPKTIGLLQNYPNPFNASTIILYSLPEQSEVQIDIYDILGRKVETLLNCVQLPGEHSLQWQAGGYSSGVYYYKLTTGELTNTRKLLLIK